MPTTVAKFVEAFKRVGKEIDWETDDTKDGNTILRTFYSSERYLIDFADDFKSEGWMQFDTDQDASYFGVWVNPTKLMTLSYAEGDWTLVICPDSDRYNRSVQRMCEFYGEGFEAIAYDSEWNRTIYRQDRSMFFAKKTT